MISIPISFDPDGTLLPLDPDTLQTLMEGGGLCGLLHNFDANGQLAQPRLLCLTLEVSQQEDIGLFLAQNQQTLRLDSLTTTVENESLTILLGDEGLQLELSASQLERLRDNLEVVLIKMLYGILIATIGPAPIILSVYFPRISRTPLTTH